MSTETQVEAPRGLIVINKPMGITSRKALDLVEGFADGVDLTKEALARYLG